MSNQPEYRCICSPRREIMSRNRGKGGIGGYGRGYKQAKSAYKFARKAYPVVRDNFNNIRSTANQMRKADSLFGALGAGYGGVKRLFNINSALFHKSRKRVSRKSNLGKENPISKNMKHLKNDLNTYREAKGFQRSYQLGKFARPGRGPRMLGGINGKCCRVTHSELIMSIYGTANVLQPIAIPISFSSTILAPFAAGIATRFQRYKVHSVRLDYQGSAGTGQDGKLWLGAMYKPKDFDITIYDDTSQFAQLQDTPLPDHGCPLWSSCGFNLQPKMFAKGTDGTLQTYTGDVTAVKSDPEQISGGYIIVLVDCPDSGAMGTLWVHYDVTFYESIKPPVRDDTYLMSKPPSNPSALLTTVANTSTTPVTTLKKVDSSFGAPNNLAIVMSEASSYFISITYYGTGMYDDDSANIQSTDMAYDIYLSQGCSLVFQTGTSRDNRQTVDIKLTMLQNSVMWFVPNEISTVTGFSMYLAYCNDILSYSLDPDAPPQPYNKLPYHPIPPLLLSQAHQHYKVAGVAMKLGFNACRQKSQRSKFWYLHSAEQEREEKYGEKTPNIDAEHIASVTTIVGANSKQAALDKKSAKKYSILNQALFSNANERLNGNNGSHTGTDDTQKSVSKLSDDDYKNLLNQNSSMRACAIAHKSVREDDEIKRANEEFVKNYSQHQFPDGSILHEFWYVIDDEIVDKCVPPHKIIAEVHELECEEHEMEYVLTVFHNTGDGDCPVCIVSQHTLDVVLGAFINGNQGSATNTDDVCWLLLLFVVAFSQQPPIKTTTRQPTSHPNTNYPSLYPTTTSTPTTAVPTTIFPTKSPTDPVNHFSLIKFTGSNVEPFTTTIDLAEQPLLVMDVDAFVYNGIHGYPVNLTFELTISNVLSGYVTIGQDGVTAELLGTNAVETAYQTSNLYATVANAGNGVFRYNAAPSMAPTPDLVGILYCGKILRLPPQYDIHPIPYNYSLN